METTIEIVVICVGVVLLAIGARRRVDRPSVLPLPSVLEQVAQKLGPGLGIVSDTRLEGELDGARVVFQSGDDADPRRIAEVTLTEKDPFALRGMIEAGVLTPTGAPAEVLREVVDDHEARRLMRLIREGTFSTHGLTLQLVFRRFELTVDAATQALMLVARLARVVRERHAAIDKVVQRRDTDGPFRGTPDPRPVEESRAARAREVRDLGW